MAGYMKAFEKWARLPTLNLSLATYPAMKNQIGGGKTYRDPTTEIARAAWFAGMEHARTIPERTSKAQIAYFSVDRDELTGGLQLSINNGNGGYRIAGPTYCGCSKTLLKHVITESDALEIRAALATPTPDAQGG